MSEQVQEQAVQAPPAPRKVTRLDITSDISSKLGSMISSVLREDVEQKPIVIDMCSVGGDVNAGNTIAHVLSSHGAPVTFFCGVYNYSMAAMLIQFSDFVRLCYPSSRFMFHHTSYSYEGTVDEIVEIKRWAEFGDKNNRVAIQEGIGLTEKEAKKILGSHDKYFLPKEMLALGEHGAIDGIIISRVGDHKYLCETRDGLKVIDTYIHRRGDIKNIPAWSKPE